MFPLSLGEGPRNNPPGSPFAGVDGRNTFTTHSPPRTVFMSAVTVSSSHGRRGRGGRPPLGQGPDAEDDGGLRREVAEQAVAEERQGQGVALRQAGEGLGVLWGRARSGVPAQMVKLESTQKTTTPAAVVPTMSVAERFRRSHRPTNPEAAKLPYTASRPVTLTGAQPVT